MTRMAWMALAVVVLGTTLGLMASRQPWDALDTQRKATDREQTRMREAEADREVLVRKVSRYQSDLGWEEAARRRGYVPKSEQPAK